MCVVLATEFVILQPKLAKELNLPRHGSFSQIVAPNKDAYVTTSSHSAVTQTKNMIVHLIQ